MKQDEQLGIGHREVRSESCQLTVRQNRKRKPALSRDPSGKGPAVIYINPKTYATRASRSELRNATVSTHMHSDNFTIVNPNALGQLHDCQPICTQTTSCMPHSVHAYVTVWPI